MKTLKYTFIIAVLFGLLVQSKDAVAPSVPNTAYKAGETLKYLVHFGWIDGGVAGMTIEEKTVSGKKIHHAKAIAKSVGLCEKMYKVRDVYESYIDPETGLPIMAIRNISEDTYKYYDEVTYNHEANTVKSSISGVHEVPNNCFDMVSAFYYARRALFSKELRYDEIIRLDTWFADELFPLEVRYKGKETINSKVGKINCLKFVPVVETGRIFDREDDLKIWVSNDKNFIPVRIQMDLFIGSIKCDLVEYDGLRNNFAKQ